MEKPFPGGREVVRQALLQGRVPLEALDVCLASITESTLKQYSGGLRLWWTFYINNDLYPYKVAVEDVLDFLTIHFNRGATYGTLNSYKSAISQIAGPNFSQDYRLERFCKGLFSKRPPSARYANIWDPQVVLSYVKTLKTEDITLENLSKKTAVLLALATGHRIQTLTLININKISVQPQKILIKISDKNIRPLKNICSK